MKLQIDKEYNFQEGEKGIFNNVEYIFENGILRQKDLYSKQQSQTNQVFSYKWKKRETYESKEVQNKSKNWMMEKYFDNNLNNIKKILNTKKTMLDAGCGAAFSSLALFEEFFDLIDYYGADISDSVDVASQRFQEKGIPGQFIQANLLNLPFEKEAFDIIFSEGVLHHTDSTKESIKYLSEFLVRNGYFIFYVYKKKAPIREFSDDYIREYLKNKSPDEAWEMLMPLSKLGKIIGDLNIEIEVKEEIEILGIPKGKINLQRLIYNNIFKCFYDSSFSLEEMNHLNFDWYTPLNCHRHTVKEINNYCEDASLNIERMYTDDSGISVIAKKKMI